MNNFLPITAAIAIILFVIKEGLEFFRRRNSEKRELEALKLLISHELQRNHWAIKSLNSIIDQIAAAVENGALITIIYDANENERIQISSENGMMLSSSPLPQIHDVFISNKLTRIALLDRTLFDACVSASEALTELRHVRSSAKEHVSSQEFLEGFADWAKEEISDVMPELDKLYRICTGKELSEFRVR